MNGSSVIENQLNSNKLELLLRKHMSSERKVKCSAGFPGRKDYTRFVFKLSNNSILIYSLILLHVGELILEIRQTYMRQIHHL